MKPLTSLPAAVDAVIRRHAWSAQDVADRLGVSPHTLRSWIKPETARSHRAAPSWAVHALTALLTGKPVSERRGALRVTYEAVP
jgi:transposase-like protein